MLVFLSFIFLYCRSISRFCAWECWHERARRRADDHARPCLLSSVCSSILLSVGEVLYETGHDRDVVLFQSPCRKLPRKIPRYLFMAVSIRESNPPKVSLSQVRVIPLMRSGTVLKHRHITTSCSGNIPEQNDFYCRRREEGKSTSMAWQMEDEGGMATERKISINVCPR